MTLPGRFRMVRTSRIPAGTAPCRPRVTDSEGLRDTPTERLVAPDDATLRLAQEVADTHQRIRLGGIFYAAGWLLVCATAGVNDAAAWVVGAVFVVLAVARMLLRVPQATNAEAYRRWLWWPWSLALATAALGGAVSVLAWMDARFEPARPVVLFTIVAFATAFAHSVAMRRPLALIAIALVYLPVLVAIAIEPGQGALAIALAIYAVYVVLAMLRSHAEYRSRLDIDSELRRQRDRFEQQSRRDGLTGLANRRRFAAALAEMSRAASESGTPFALAVLDLDHFKAVNDRHGHSAGDQSLIALAQRLRDAFGGPGELTARLGGEEFGVLLPDPGAALARVEAFRSALAGATIDTVEATLRLTISGGFGVFDPATHRDGDALYREVDAALYRAKSGGRDRICTTGSPPATL